MLLAAGTGWAGGRKGPAEAGKDKEAPASFNKTFQWEEKVVGPKDKAVDRDRIAAMQEQGRREDAKRRETPRKPVRTEGINGPASSVIPTQDIEKPSTARAPIRRASYTPPKQHDEIDNVLADNGVGSGSDEGRDGLSKVFAHSSGRSTSPPKAHKVAIAKRVKHGRRRH